MTVPSRLYTYRYRNARDGEKEWHVYPTWPSGVPLVYIEPPGPLHCDERYEVEVVEYALVEYSRKAQL